MTSADTVQDVIVIGAGPVGLACAIEARREGLVPRVIEKGSLVNSIVGYPVRMEFFSTPELIEIGGYPFPVQAYKPTREEAIEYYRGVAEREKLAPLPSHESLGISAGAHRAIHENLDRLNSLLFGMQDYYVYAEQVEPAPEESITDLLETEG